MLKSYQNRTNKTNLIEKVIHYKFSDIIKYVVVNEELTSDHRVQTHGDTSHSHARTETLTGACPASEHGARQAGTELRRAVSSGGTTFTPPHSAALRPLHPHSQN